MENNELELSEALNDLLVMWIDRHGYDFLIVDKAINVLKKSKFKELNSVIQQEIDRRNNERI